jgi:hypothetical protein
MAKRLDYAELVARAEKAVAAITDPELKRIAFQKALDDLGASTSTSFLDSTSKLIQVLAVVVGVTISVLSFNAARVSEAKAREAEGAKRQIEAAKPFLELRQRLYLEAVQAAGVLANPKNHTEDETKKAKKRFCELYVAELSLVEGIGVAKGMVRLANVADPDLSDMTDEQEAAYELAHALRDSLVESWAMDKALVDE